MKKIIKFILNLFKCRSVELKPTPVVHIMEGKCYSYEYINRAEYAILFNQIDCDGIEYSIEIPTGKIGMTTCIFKLSDDLIENYNNLGLILTPTSLPCG